MNGFGQIEAELRALDMKPEERQALIRGEYVPERLREFERTRQNEQQRLQGQLDRTTQMIGDNPIQVHGNNTAMQLGGLAANALRSFGGMYLAHQKEKEMADAQAASDRQFQDLIKMYEDASGAGLDTKKRGLSGAANALRLFDDGYST